MATKKSGSSSAGTARKSTSTASKKSSPALSKTAKKALKKLHPLTIALAVAFLAIGLAAGVAACIFMSKNDHFELKGDAFFSVNVGDTYTYADEGVDAVCFGRDVSGKVRVETDLATDANGNYIIPTDKEGVYTIAYTVDALKFQKGENGVIKRIRTFVVSAEEEDGRNG